MTFQEALKKEKRWNKRVFIINLYHKSKMLKHSHWTMRATAKKLKISLGQVSEAIKLAKALIDNPELEKLQNRVEALDVINGKGRIQK